MNTKQRKRQRDIKTKLMAAICMLLVSSIMMVSTTYAWFTLSTAPEVTGINTAVGANGALEMALLPLDGSVESIGSAVGDSMTVKDKVAANVTWGNLVDLEATDAQDNNLYGLDKIQLMPSRLNIAAGKVDVTGYYLKTPVYGYDGRVSNLTANVVASAFKDNKFLASNNEYGVRALGSATSMSARELGFRTFKGNANAARLDAQNIAGEALQKNGQVLANMAIAHVTGTETFGATEKAAVQAIITAMIGEKGAVTNIEKALKNYVLMAVSSKFGQDYLDLDIYEANIAKWEALTLDQLMSENYTVKNAEGQDETVTNVLYTLTNQFTAVKTAKSELDAIKTNMNAAQELVNGLTGDSYTWEQMRAIMAYMVNPDTMVVNGHTVPQISANNNLLINSYMETGKLEISLYNGSGVFADIARFCGNYDTTIDLKINFAGLDTQTTAQMYAVSANKTEAGIANVTPHYTKILNVIDDQDGFQGAPAAETGTESPLTDLYGYIIDLAFRTNAADANLQLQTAAIDRIYSDNKDQNSETWGGGSYMTFKGTTGFTNEQVKNLMDCINVVFFDKDDGTIYGIAKLDTENATENTSGVTARLFMMDYTINDGAMVFNGIKGSNIEYMTGTPLFAASEQNPATTAGAKVSVHVPEGMTVNGNYHVPTTGNEGYTFTLAGKADRTDYIVSYVVGDAAPIELTADADAKYTIPVLPTGTTAVTIDVKAVFTKTALLTGDTDAENLAEVTEGNVDVTATIPVGVTMTGNSVTTKYTTNADGEKATGADYSFTLGNPMNGATYTVTYKVGAGEEKLLTLTEGKYTIPEKEITDNVVITVKESRPFEAEGTITRLVQNEGKAISALVYLDGDNITNADVANAASSMTGSMNLQFSTNVPLVPMEYTPLMGQTTVPETTAPQNP